jgi:hypothetical protein
MESLAHQQCSNHRSREAVARCPECRQFFCRECITEHEDRVLCAACLRKLARPRMVERFRLVGLLRLAQSLAGLIIVWLFFYWVGQLLLSLPSAFHDGSIWNVYQ